MRSRALARERTHGRGHEEREERSERGDEEEVAGAIADDADELSATTVEPMTPTETAAGSTRYEAVVPLPHAGVLGRRRP